jgi:peroxiredoxin/protocatechuate 3,4-dioxygenase beta subunit
MQPPGLLRLRLAAVLWLLALAVGSPPRVAALGPDAQSQTLTVEARDPVTDAPVAGVSFKLILPSGANLQATTKADGIARFQYALPESPGRRYFSLRAHRAGLVPAGARWTYAPTSPTPPAHLRFWMEKATTISGRVLDQDSQPLSSAVVVVTVKKSYPQSQQWVDVGLESAETDEKGRWSFSSVPERPDSLEIAAYHYLCLTEHAAFYPEPFEPLSALRDGSAVLRLRRGTKIDGTVLSPDGRPVADAQILYGEDRGYGNSIPPVKPDARGKFTLGIKPGTHATVIAISPGFAPTLKRTKVGEGSLRVQLTLEPAHSVRGRVVDRSGKPIARAQVRMFWSGPDSSPTSTFGAAITHNLTTDHDGRFDWNEAPGRGVHASVYADGYSGTENMSLAADVDQKIVLIPPTSVKGRVVDRDTGQPIPRFSLTLAAAWNLGDPFIWQNGRDLDRESSKSPGAFEFTTPRPAQRYLVRVQAEGYLPADSEPFTPDGTARALTFRLKKAEPIRGSVRDPDGSTAREGFVYIVPAHRDGWIEYLSLSNDDVADRDRSRTVHAKVAADGRFSLPAQPDNFALLALTEKGSALVPRDMLHGDDVLQLRPWAHVTGTVMFDGKPAANLELQSYDPEDSAPVVGRPRMERRWYVKTDADGRFELPRVLPGRLTLAQWMPNGVNRRIWPVIRASLDVRGGESYDLKIGTSGRLVTGRLVLPRADVWMIRTAEIVSRLATAARSAPIGLDVLEGGQLRALDLKPGDYSLRIALHEPPPGDSCGWGRLLGEYLHDFSVPAGTAASDAALDLGTLEPIALAGRPLQVGDRAPDFAIKTLEGNALTLADFHGRYVLLDFWASWCAPCLTEMPNLLAIKKQFAKDSRFVVIGVSLDDRPRDAAATVKALELSWPQGIAGPDSPVVAAYGATAIPATFLIGPDGKIIARDLRGQQTRSAVAAALKP